MKTFTFFAVARPVARVWFGGFLALALPAYAGVTNIVWFRLGENDPGAASGAALTNTSDLVGLENLVPVGAPLYSGSVSPAAIDHIGSFLGAGFNGTSQNLSNAVVSAAVDNFGIEAWVKPNTTAGGLSQVIAYNGIIASPGYSGGWGIVQNGSTYYGLFGGVTTVGSGNAVAGTWTHLALVRNNGIATLYVNGVASVGTVFTPPNPPQDPVNGFFGGFAIGGHPQVPAGEFFNGTIDEVRVFRFTFDVVNPGVSAFTTNDLLVNLERVQTLATTTSGSTLATVNGAANPPGLPTQAWFEWGTTTNYGNSTAPQLLAASAGATNFSQNLTGLAAGSVYYFRAAVSNGLGVAYGSAQSFGTPFVATLPATALGANAAMLNGAANPAGSGMSGYFEFGLTTSYGSSTTPQFLGNATATTNFSYFMAGISSGATYHYRAVATRNGENIYGGDESFTTPLLPMLATLPISDAGVSNATLNGAANPEGSPTSAWFEWGQASLDHSTPAVALGGGSNTLNFSQTISGLAPGVTYVYRAAGSNTAGVAFGTNQSFTTALPPAVTTLPATDFPSYALNFDGVDDWVASDVFPFPSTFNSFTMELWANPTAARAVTPEANSGITGAGGQRYAIFPQNGTASIYAGAGLSIGTNGISVFEQMDNYLPSLLVYQAPINGWAHVAVVYENQTPRLYVNGQLVRTGLTSTKDVRPSANLGGSTNPYGNFQGQLDEFRVWSKVLSQAQIQRNMNRRLNGDEWGLAGYFRCDEGSGATVANDAFPIPGAFSGLVQGILTNGTAFVFPGVPSTGPLAGNTATLRAAATSTALPATLWFEWGATTNYAYTTPPRTVEAGSVNTNFFELLTALTPGDYNYRAMISNSFGIAYGGNESFTIPLFYDSGAFQGRLLDSSSVAWGDFDNDGRLDILETGIYSVADQSTNGLTEVWLNAGNRFTNIVQVFRGAGPGTQAWGDYNNDQRLDLLQVGYSDIFFGTGAQIFQNTGTNFSEFQTLFSNQRPLVTFSQGSAAWGDYNNDGKLDFALIGVGYPAAPFTQVWQNRGFVFVDSLAGLPGVSFPSVAWGDYDNDGLLDLLVAGAAPGEDLFTGYPTNAICEIYRNTGNGFSNINAGITAVHRGSVAWGDFDNDGRLDVLVAGVTNNSIVYGVTQVWRNTGNGFSNIDAGLPGIGYGCAVWGDYDNDGRLDILLTGTTNGSTPAALTQLWRNTGNGFSNVNINLPQLMDSQAAWGDFDNDGRLDLLLTGYTAAGEFITQLWRNNTRRTNTPPTAPTGLTATVASNAVTFSWSPASDAQTPASGLTYNLRVGTSPGGGDLVGPMAASTGLRRLPQMGNAQQNCFRRMVDLPLGRPLYWSVQAVDTAFAGGPFAAEQTLTCGTVLTPPNGVPVPGDMNGDGMVSESELSAVLSRLNGNGAVSQSELTLVLSNYLASGPPPYMANVAGLGGPSVTFALSNSTAPVFGVEYTTNFTDWNLLGPAVPRYLFTDTNAPSTPQRFYRLRWP